MQKYDLLSALILMIGIMLYVDYAYKLAWFQDWQRTVKTLAVGITVFLIWDTLGIGFAIFHATTSHFDSGVRLGHSFPLEEFFFLFDFCYLTLLLWLLGERYVSISRR